MRIYTTEKITRSRTGRQYENTCSGCKQHFEVELENGHIDWVCKTFSAMDNQVRCIKYEATQDLNTIQTIIS
jgi:hypothetical protein